MLEPPRDTVNRGDMASVHVVLFEKDGVLKLPTEFVHTYQNRRYVNVLRDGIKSEKLVEVGITTNLEVEIVAGLQEGETIVR